MNIAFYWERIPIETIGGIDRVTITWASSFLKHGHKTFLLYRNGRNKKLPVSFISACSCNNFTSKEDVRIFLKKNNIDIIINQQPYSSELINYLSDIISSLNIRIITVFHSMPGFEFYCKPGVCNKIKKKTWIFFNRFKIYQHYNNLIKKSFRIIVFSESYVWDFLNFYHIPAIFKEKIYVIPNPLSFDSNLSSDYQSKKNIVLVVSRLSEQEKRISLILEIWKEFISYTTHWDLVICGEGPDMNTYINFVRSNNLLNVYFKGKVDPIPFYKDSKIFLQTSSYEGWPLTLLEAMQLGVVPIVMSSYGAANDVIISKENGFLVYNDDLKEFIDKLILLTDNPSILEDMGKNARKSVLKYAPDKLQGLWEDLFSMI